MRRSCEVVVPILNSEYKVIVLVSRRVDYVLEKLNSWGYGVDKEYVEEALNDRRGVTFNKPGCHPVIAVWDLHSPELVGTLAHEATHALFYIFDKLGEPCYNHEVFSHSVGAVVREVMGRSWER